MFPDTDGQIQHQGKKNMISFFKAEKAQNMNHHRKERNMIIFFMNQAA